MGKRKVSTGSCLFVCVIIIFAAAVGVCADKITITGVVVAMDWDDKDNVVAVSIETDSELYYVSENAAGEKLRELLDRGVKVTGIPGKDEEGNKTIAVETYEILDD